MSTACTSEATGTVKKRLPPSIRSLFTWPENTHPGVYYLVVRVPAAAGAKAAASLENSGFKVLSQYVKDLSPYLPAS